jgi:SsrA-binding protein
MSVLAKNPIGKSDYELLDTFEAGLVLSGQEVKSIRGGHLSLKGAWGVIQKGEVYIIGMHVSPYPPAGPMPGYDPTHSRKVLLTARELYDVKAKIQRDGLTLVPLQLYSKGRFLKLSLGLGRRKKKYEKRAAIKDREVDREIRRSLKTR